LNVEVFEITDFRSSYFSFLFVFKLSLDKSLLIYEVGLLFTSCKFYIVDSPILSTFLTKAKISYFCFSLINYLNFLPKITDFALFNKPILYDLALGVLEITEKIDNLLEGFFYKLNSLGLFLVD